MNTQPTLSDVLTAAAPEQIASALSEANTQPDAQPEALRLADLFENYSGYAWEDACSEAAAELRRLQTEIEALKARERSQSDVLRRAEMTLRNYPAWAGLGDKLYTHPAPVSQCAPELYKLVPIEPTGEMEIAGALAYEQSRCHDNIGPLQNAWAAMLAAAQEAPAPSQQAEQLTEEWSPCMKLPVVVHVRKQRLGESHVSTREGITPVKPDDLIMRGVSGEEYPIGRKIFEQTYRTGAFDSTSQQAAPWQELSLLERIALWEKHGLNVAQVDAVDAALRAKNGSAR